MPLPSGAICNNAEFLPQGTEPIMNTFKKHLAYAAAAAATVSTTAAYAADFTASATLQNTLTVVSVADFDIGTVFASQTGAGLTDGVGALVIGADGTVTDPADSATVSLTSLTTPTPGQGSIDMTADFFLTLPDTSSIDAADFAADAGSSLVNITNGNGNAAELVHETGNPSVPSLWLMHFSVGDVSGGISSEGTPNQGDFTVVQDFGESSFIFNIGATLTTEPTAAAETYQEGIYTGTFEITASY